MLMRSLFFLFFGGSLLWCSCITDLYDFFFERAWGGTLVLPLSANLSTSGHARRSYVTALHIFLLKRACETLLRYRSSHIFTQAGMREPLTLPLFTYFYSSGHTRLSCVTVRRDFPRFKMKKGCPINRLSVAGQPFLSVFSATTSFTSVCY